MSAIIEVLQGVAVALFGNGETGAGAVAGAIPTFWEWLTKPAVLPYFLIGVGVSLLLLAVRVVKGIFWGV